MNRCAIGNLIESIDYMDPTRSHEMLPSERMRAKRHDQRRAVAFVTAALILAALLVLAAY